MATTVNQQGSPNENSSDVLSGLLARAYTLNWEAIAYIVIFILATVTRFYMLGDRVMSHDESLHTRYSYNLATDLNFQHTPLMHGPILFHFTALFYVLFGANDFTSRLYPAILGVIVVMMPLLFRRWLGRWGALLSSIMLLISPITLYYNRYIRHDTPNIFFSLLMIYGIFQYTSGSENQRRRAHWLYLIAGAMLMNLGSKETAFFYVLIMGLFLAIYWFVRLAQHFYSIPGRTTLYTIIMSFCVAGVVSLGMYAVLSVNLGEREFFAAIQGLSSPTTLIVWSSVVVGIVTLIVSGSILAAFRGSTVRLGIREGLIFIVLALLFSMVLMYAEESSRSSHSAATTAEPADPTAETEATLSMPQINTQLPAENAMAPFVNPVIRSVNYVLGSPIILLAWIVSIAVTIFLYYAWRQGWIRYLSEQFPEFDVLVLIGTMIVPWATPLLIRASGFSPTDYSAAGIERAITAIIPMFLMTGAFGILWNARRWVISNLIFYSLFFFFFTTLFTNSNGVASGIIGSLGYWLEQQGVRRGSQPQYYYIGVIMPIYEFLPMLGGLFAMGGGLTWFWRFRRSRLEEAANNAIVESSGEGEETPRRRLSEADTLKAIPFLPFVAWWGILNLVVYTLSGEKMPWLAIHITLPLILLTGWFFGRIIEKVNARRFFSVGWLNLILMPLFFVLLARLLGPFLIGAEPIISFSGAGGMPTVQLQQTMLWLALLAITVAVGYGIFRLVTLTGVQHMRQMIAVSLFAFLSVITFRSAWMASYINYDLANEFLVYAHAAPAVKQVLNDIEDLSRRTTDGRDIQFLYDNEVSWPYSWYFRDFTNATFTGGSFNAQQVDNAVVAVVGASNRSKIEPLLEDRFYSFEYIRLWWPMQDYFNLQPSEVHNVLNFFGGDEANRRQSAQMREGLFNIWWARDYDAYGAAVNRPDGFTLTQWPVSDRMYYYVRKDIAEQVWNLGVGESLVRGADEDRPVNYCIENWNPVQPELVYGVNGGITMQNPIGVSVGSDGNLYVADEGAHQVVVFNSAGEFVRTIGQQGASLADGQLIGHAETAGLFERPNSVAVAPDGNLFVVDTWNYRIQEMTTNGEFLAGFGRPGQFGADAPAEPVDGFWGPREAIIGNDGYLYVSDTGNKRIRVYSVENNEFELIRDIGASDDLFGSLNEPTGIALHPDGRLFVADTWNRRIAVFSQEGEALYSFMVQAWYTDQGNRPYLAIDPNQNILYVTDPDAGRVLVYDLDGTCVASIGQAASDPNNPAPGQFVLATGITVDPESGQIYISDPRAGRVSRFAAFDRSSIVIPDEEAVAEDQSES